MDTELWIVRAFVSKEQGINGVKEKKSNQDQFNPSDHGRFSRPITHIENGIKRFLYVHIAYP